MTSITLRSIKGAPLTNTEVDNNFSNLNNYKVEQSDSTGSALIPSGTSAQRDGSPIAGMFRYNNELTRFEGYFSKWEKIAVNLDSDAILNSFSAGTGLNFSNGQYTISNTGVTAGTYGSASQVPVFTVNAQGQLDSAGTVSVAGVSNTSWDSSTGNLIINTADGGSFYTKVTLDPYSTTNLAEGTNLYYTAARADSDAKNAISVTDAGGDGSLAYNSSTGILTYTGPSATEVRAHFSAGTGVTLSSGQISIGQAVGITDSAVFASLTTTGNIIVGGNLQVTGTTTTVNSQTLEVTDNMIYMNAAESDGSPTQSVDVGWAANVNDDGTYMHVGMFRDATDNTFKVFENYTPEPDAAVEINTGHASFSLAPFAARTVTADSATFTGLNGTNATFSGNVDAANFNSTSDERLKDNIQKINGALDKVTLIRGVTFNFKGTGNVSMGVIAQEVEEVAPEVVTEINGYKAVNYDGLIGLLIESIKELKQEVEALKKN